MEEFPIGPAKALLTLVVVVGICGLMLWDVRRNPPEE